MRHWREGTKTSSKGGSGRAETDGLTISPLINTDRKGGAFRIMHQQFRRAIGCAIVRGQAKLALGRLHYVRATREEAASVSKSHHSNNRWAPSQQGRSSWFNSGGIYNF